MRTQLVNPDSKGPILGVIPIVLLSLLVFVSFFLFSKMGRMQDGILLLWVDYARSIEKSIEAGCYSPFDQGITSGNFPAQENEHGKKQIRVKIFHFNKYMDTYSVEVEMKKKGCRHGTARELLALGEKVRELLDLEELGVIQEQMVIVALGSRSPTGSVVSLVIRGGGKCPSLYLTEDCPGDEWTHKCHFLGVQE